MKLVKKKTRQVERDPVVLGETSNNFSLALIDVPMCKSLAAVATLEVFVCGVRLEVTVAVTFVVVFFLTHVALEHIFRLTCPC